jgi:hypothetical protein
VNVTWVVLAFVVLVVGLVTLAVVHDDDTARCRHVVGCGPAATVEVSPRVPVLSPN